MVPALRVAAHPGRQTPALALIILGLLLVPVQCSLGLHSIFVAATTLAAASPAPETEHQHKYNHPTAHASDTSDSSMTPADQGRSSAPQQSPPSPIKSAAFDHPYSVVLSRFVPSVDELNALLPLLSVTSLAPDGIAVAPELPPPRRDG